MNIINKTGYPKIDQAIEYFNKNLESMLIDIHLLEEHKYFTYTEDTNKEVVKKVRAYINSNPEIEINRYKPFWSRSSVIGYTQNGKYFINQRKINSLSIQEWAGNIAHEIFHLILYKHGNNFPSPKKRVSVPYFFGYLISGEMELTDLIDNKYQR